MTRPGMPVDTFVGRGAAGLATTAFGPNEVREGADAAWAEVRGVDSAKAYCRAVGPPKGVKLMNTRKLEIPVTSCPFKSNTW